MPEITKYDKYNTLNESVEGPGKPKKESTTNKYEALRQSGVETSVIGRNENEKSKAFMGSKDDGPGNIVAGQDINESRSYNQGGLENIFSGISKGTGLAGTTFASTFSSLPYGILKATYEGLATDKSGSEAFSSIYDNEISQKFEELNKNMEQWFPNYYSARESKANALSWDNLASSNFWGDKVLKNVGFTVGAIFGGSKFAKGAQWLGKIAMGARYTQELGAMNSLISAGMKPAEAMSKVAKGIKFIDAATSLGASTVAAGVEGGMEAKQTKDELVQQLTNDYKVKNNSNTIPADVLHNINKMASAAGNTTFAINMALLTASDYYQFGKLFNKGFKQEVARVGNIAIKDGLVESTKDSFKKKVVKSLLGYTKNALVESGEEGSQTFTQGATKEYYTRQYNSNGNASKNDLLISTLKGLEDTFSSKEGLESILLGAITGGGSHAITSLLTGDSEDIEHTKKAVDRINQSIAKIEPFMSSYVRGASINEDKERLLKSNNPSKFLFGNLAHDEFKNIIQPYLETDRLDLLEERLRDQYTRDDISDWGTTSKKTAQEYVGNLLSEAKRLQKIWDTVDTRFPSANKDAKLALWDTMSNIENRDNRANDLQSKIYAESGVHYDTVIKNGGDFLGDVQSAIDNGKIGADINDARDLIQLVNQKKDLVNKYKALLDPSEQAKVAGIVNQAKIKLEEATKPKGEVQEKAVEPIEVTPTESSQPESSDSITQPEIVAPKASNELDEDIVNESFSNLKNMIDGELTDSNHQDLIDTLSEMRDEAKTSEDKEALNRGIEYLQSKDNSVTVGSDENDTLVEDEVAKGERLAKERVKAKKKLKNELITYANQLVSDGATREEVVQGLEEALEDKTDELDREVFSEVIDAFKKKIDSLRAEEEANRKEAEQPKVPEKVGVTEVLDEEEAPTISEQPKIHASYSEFNYMSHTTFRTTANHEEAYSKDINSVLRYQNFLHNPENNFTGLQLLVINDKHPLYTKLQNKKQKGYSGGVLALVVDQDNNALIANANGSVSNIISINDLIDSEDDIDSDSGVLVTALVKEPNQKNSGYNTVSYKNFAKKHGLTYIENEEPREGTPIGDLWAKHKQDLSIARKAMEDGSITHLAIIGMSPGIFNRDVVGDRLSTIEEVFGVDHNNPNIQFIIAKHEGLSTPGYAEVGSTEGLREQQLVRIGKPYLSYKGILYPLKPRNITGLEAKLITQLLDVASTRLANGDTNGYNKAITEVKKFVFISPNRESASKVNNGIWIEGNTIHFDNKSISLSSINGNAELSAFLLSKYRQVNAADLHNNPLVTSVSSVNLEKGFINYTKNKITYRDSIFGSTKSSAIAPLGLNMLPAPKGISDPSNFMNGYLEYTPILSIVNELPVVEVEREAIPESTTLKVEEKSTKRKKKKLDLGDDDATISLDRLAKLKTSNKVENIEETKQWFKDRFDNISDKTFKVVNSLINGNSFGQWTRDAITLFSGAEIGTGYHEAFHKVTQEYLSPKERKSLYDEVRQEEGKKKYTDKQAEEYSAEDFRQYMLSGQKVIKGKVVRNNIFRKLYQFLRTLLTGKTSLEQVYNRLAKKGAYIGAKKFSPQFNDLRSSAIKGLTYTQTKNIIDTINGHFFNVLFSSNLTPNQLVGEKGREIVAKAYEAVRKRLASTYNKLDEDDYNEEEYEAILEHYDYMLSINDEGDSEGLAQGAIEAHKKYLAGLGVYLHPLVGSEEVEDDPQEDNDIDTRDRAQWVNSNEVDPLTEIPNAVKLLIMSLPEVDEDGDPVANSIEGPELVNFRKTYSLLLKTLANMSQYDEMYNKLQSIVNEYPSIKYLLDRIKAPGAASNLDQFILQQQFRQSFSKFESKGTTMIINSENGDYYEVDANSNRLQDKIRDKWISNLRLEDNKYITKTDEGYLTVDLEREVNGKKLRDLSPRQMLSELGIRFSDYTDSELSQAIKDETEDVNLQDIQSIIYKAISKLVKEGKPVNDLFDRQSDIVGRMNSLLAVEAKVSKEVVELSYLNAENKRIYSISLNNYYSLITNAINSSSSYTDLITKYPHLDNPYTQSSVWLMSIFPNKGVKRIGAKLEMNTRGGLKIQNDPQSGTNETGLEVADKVSVDINSLLLYGNTSLTRAGDKASEYAYRIDKFKTSIGDHHLPVPLSVIEENGFNNEDVKAIFLGYFNDELSRIRAFNIDSVGKNIQIYSQLQKDEHGKLIPNSEPARNWSIFADILSDSTKQSLEDYMSNEEVLTEDLTQQIKKDIIAFLNAYSMGTRERDGIKQYLRNLKIGLVRDNVYTGISSRLGNPTKGNIDNIIRAFAVNHLINTIEQHKLLIGDPAFYKDKFKRISGGTGTKKTASVGQSINNWLNEFYKTKGRIDEKEADGIVRTVVFNDHKVFSSMRDEYYNTMVNAIGEERASSLIKAYEEMDEGDAQGWITLDEYREFFIRTGEWSIDHEKQYQWEIANEKGLDAGQNPEFFFMPIKAQHFGAQKLDEKIYAPAFHKYSLAPIYHSLVAGRNMESLLESMRKNKVGYALFGSGAKVGTLLGEDGKLPSFYNKEGEISGITESTPIQQINYEFLGIQLDIAAKQKEKNIFGSQFRKLILSNLFSGDNVDLKMVELKDEYTKIIDTLVDKEFTKLLKDLDITREGEAYKFNNGYTKLINTLRENLADKDTADNLIDSLQVDDKGNLLYPIDSLVNRPKVESMLFSIVNSRVIKQKMPGDGMVQLASSGYENRGKRTVGSSNYLGFYRVGKDGRTLGMEVEVPMNPQFEPLLKKYKTLDALNKAIANNEIDKKMLTMVGYRIPTQGLNSIDFMTIKRFLPSSNGNSIILPTEVVAKSGGDYDIDKLNIFRPNLEYDEKNDSVIYIQMNNTIDKTSKEALQNRIIEISTDILSDPINFANLIIPNTTETLTDLVGDIREARGEGRKPTKASATQELRFDHIMNQFAYFLGGKAGVGIGAVHNTHHTLSQIAKTAINSEIPFKHNSSGTITIEDISNNSKKDISVVDLGAMNDKGGNLISDIISQFINAYVDVAKDPFYKDLNAGTEVASVWFYLIRAGVDIKTIAYFMTQPIIIDYVNNRKINKSLVVRSNDMTKNPKQVTSKSRAFINKQVSKLEKSMSAAIKAGNMSLAEYYERKITKKNNRLESIYDESLAMFGSPKEMKSIDWSADDINSKLLGWIKEGQSDKYSDEFQSAQKRALEYFIQFEKDADELTTLMRGTNQDTTKLQNYGSILSREVINQNIDNSTVVSSQSQSDILSKTIVGSFNKTNDIKNMFSSLMLSTSRAEIKRGLDNLLLELQPKSRDYEKLYNMIQNDFIGYITQSYGYTKDDKRLIDRVQDLFSGKNSLAKRLVKINKDGLLDSNPLISELQAIISGDTLSVDNIKMYSKRLSAFESNIITGAFRELLEAKDPKVVSFAQDLGYLAILQSGLNNSPISFTEFVPYEFYGDIVKNAIDKVSAIDLDDFKVRFYLKNQGDNRVIPYINNDNRFRLQDRLFVKQYSKDSERGYTILVRTVLGEETTFIPINTTKYSDLYNTIKPIGYRLQDFGLGSETLRYNNKPDESSTSEEDIDTEGLEESGLDTLEDDQVDSDNEVQLQKNSEESILDESYVRSKLESLSKRFNLPFGIINDKNLKWAGKFHNGEAVINLAYVKKDTPFHEYAHPFIRMIKAKYPVLYNRLSKEVIDSEVFRTTAIKYPELRGSQQVEEAIVQSLGVLASQQNIDRSLWDSIKLMFKRIAEFLGLREEDKPYFDENTTFLELARMLADDSIKIDLSNTTVYGEARQKVRENQSIEDRLVSLGLLKITCKA